MAFEANNNDFDKKRGFTQQWYDSKIKDKEDNARKKMEMLSDNFTYVYDAYKNWFNKQREQKGIVLCTLVPPYIVDVQNPHGNCWKFKCMQKTPDDDSDQVTWSCIPSLNSGVNMDNPIEYPPFVIRIVEVFNDFMQEGNNKSELWTELSIVGNDMEEYMLLVTSGNNVTPNRLIVLKNRFRDNPYVKSIHLRIADEKHRLLSAEKVFGEDELYQKINGIFFKISPRLNNGMSLSSLERLFRAIKSFVSLDVETTVVGFGLGLANLLLAKECNRVLAIDTDSEIAKGKRLAYSNRISNITYPTGRTTKIINRTIGDLKSCRRSVAVLNFNSNALGIDIRPMSKELRNLSTLDEVLIISCLDTDKLQKKLIHNVMDFGDPGRENVGEPFLPQKACIVDTNPFTNNYLFLLLMKRRDYNEIANVDIYSDDDEATPEVELIDITNDQGVEKDCKFNDVETACTSEGDVDNMINELFEDAKVNNEIILPKPPPAINPKPEKLHNKDYYDDRFYDGELPRMNCERDWYNTYQVKEEFKRERYYSPNNRRYREKRRSRDYWQHDRRSRSRDSSPAPSDKQCDELLDKLFESKDVMDFLKSEEQPSTSAETVKRRRSHSPDDRYKRSSRRSHYDDKSKSEKDGNSRSSRSKYSESHKTRPKESKSEKTHRESRRYRSRRRESSKEKDLGESDVYRSRNVVSFDYEEMQGRESSRPSISLRYHRETYSRERISKSEKPEEKKKSEKKEAKKEERSPLPFDNYSYFDIVGFRDFREGSSKDLEKRPLKE